ncbi:hypothetical protein AMTRI_Chr02g258360 [Amborella trichopoda]|uniref:Uncharacterized protein n=1 Tax=Amborella trichopoda TaxID=13333 RepID=U5D7K9_AMBTC|nr:hypothetical protein AMTR_s00037p00217320 [Amborella trichopoda]
MLEILPLFHACPHHVHMPPLPQWAGLGLLFGAQARNYRLSHATHACMLLSSHGMSGWASSMFSSQGPPLLPLASLHVHSPRCYRPGMAFFLELEPDNLLSLTLAHFPFSRIELSSNSKSQSHISPMCSSLMRAATPTIPSESHHTPLAIPNRSHHLTTHHPQ